MSDLNEIIIGEIDESGSSDNDKMFSLLNNSEQFEHIKNPSIEHCYSKEGHADFEKLVEKHVVTINLMEVYNFIPLRIDKSDKGMKSCKSFTQKLTRSFFILFVITYHSFLLYSIFT